MTTKDLQAQKPLKRKNKPLPLDLSTLYSKSTFLGALKYVIQCGNFEKEKEIYQDPSMDIDGGNWSRIMNGRASFPQDKEEQLQEMCGNQGLVLWRAHRAGKGVYDLQEAKEKRIAELEKENAQLKSDIETICRLHRIGIPK